MAKRANAAEHQTKEMTAVKIPEQALMECRHACETARDRVFDQIEEQLEKIEELETKVAKGIANEFGTLSPDEYTCSQDATTRLAKEALAKSADKFGANKLNKIDAEQAKQVFKDFSNNAIANFLNQTFSGSQEAVAKAEEVDRQATQLFRFLEAQVQEIQKTRGTSLKRNTEDLIEEVSIHYQRCSHEMGEKDFYESFIYKLRRKLDMFAENTLSANQQLKKRENIDLEDILSQRMKLIDNVLLPYVGVYVYYENEAKKEAETQKQPKPRKSSIRK